MTSNINTKFHIGDRVRIVKYGLEGTIESLEFSLFMTVNRETRTLSYRVVQDPKHSASFDCQEAELELVTEKA